MNLVGPGSYGSPSMVGKTPAYTISGRTNINKMTHEQTPGPGSYSLDLSLNSSGGFTISGRTHTKTTTEDTPGPGSYVADPPKSNTGYTMSGRNFLRESWQESPGAITFDFNSHHHRPRCLFHCRKSQIECTCVHN